MKYLQRGQDLNHFPPTLLGRTSKDEKNLGVSVTVKSVIQKHWKGSPGKTVR